MQNTIFPNQLSINANANANAAAAQRNAQANANGDSGQFGAMLSSEMTQRQASPAPVQNAPAPKPEASHPQAAKPAQSEEAPAQANAAPAQTAQAGAAKDAKDTQDTTDDEAKADDAGQANADPASAMLALMASLHRQAAEPGAAKGGTAAGYDALTGGGPGLKGKRGDASQLTALQQNLKGTVDKDGAAALGKTFASPEALKNGALAAAGAALAGDDKAGLKEAAGAAAGGADAAADLHAALASLKGDARGAPNNAELALQQARDAAQGAAVQTDAVALQATQMQPAVMEAAQAAANAAEGLSARVGTDAWQNQVGQKVVWMVGSEEQTASLTLNPPDLGPMQVVLSVTNDQASVTFSSNQQEVRQALENALPRLREMMSESGIALGNATVNAGMPDGRQAQGGQQDGARAGGGWNRGERGERIGNASAVETTVRPARARALGDNGMVDTFA